MATTMLSSTQRGLLALVVLAIIAMLAWLVLTMPDQRSTGQKIGDAVDALPQGVGKAGRQLEDRTPGQRLGDSMKDAGDDVKSATKQQ